MSRSPSRKVLRKKQVKKLKARIALLEKQVARLFNLAEEKGV